MTFSPVATHSRCVLVESLNEDEFNNDAVGGIRNKSQPLLFVGVLSRPCPAQLPVSLLSMFLCPPPPDNHTKTRPQHDIPSAVKLEKGGVAANSFSLQGFPVFPFP